MTKTREELRYAAQECKDIRGLPPRWYDFDTLAITCGIGHTDAMFIAACSPDVILSLIAELDALKANAARYRWLRDGLYYGSVDVAETYITMKVVGSCPTEEQFDAAIDAAMSTKEVKNV
jgi:hypothetical protein